MPARIALATDRNLGFSSDLGLGVVWLLVNVEANHSRTSLGTASGCTSAKSSSSSNIFLFEQHGKGKQFYNGSRHQQLSLQAQTLWKGKGWREMVENIKGNNLTNDNFRICFRNLCESDALISTSSLSWLDDLGSIWLRMVLLTELDCALDLFWCNVGLSSTTTTMFRVFGTGFVCLTRRLLLMDDGDSLTKAVSVASLAPLLPVASGGGVNGSGGGGQPSGGVWCLANELGVRAVVDWWSVIAGGGKGGGGETGTQATLVRPGEQLQGKVGCTPTTHKILETNS